MSGAAISESGIKNMYIFFMLINKIPSYKQFYLVRGNFILCNYFIKKFYDIVITY